MADQQPQNIDSIYYRDGVDNDVAMGALHKARTAMFHLFMEHMQPGAETRILDIGVSDDENIASNFLEKLYPWRHQITCAGIGDGELVKRAFPEIGFVHIEPGKPLPFPDKHFDIAYSNAVIEHVGGPQQRREFILEHLRVAKKVFLTFPNRWFPVEHHTSIPLLHYWPSAFRATLRNSKLSYWTKRENLDFLDWRQIASEWPDPARKPKFSTTGIHLGPFSSNVAVIVD